MPALHRLLDLYCGEGGAGHGYALAGFDVTGVDLHAKPRYPHRFVQGDALEYLRDHGHEYDAVHASPPCQRYTHGNVAGDQALRHPDLVGPTRDLLRLVGRPYVIENVPRSPLLDPVVLCGSMFRLSATDDDGQAVVLRRHRLFESSVPLSAPGPCVHRKGEQVAGAYGGARRDKHEARHVRHGGYVPSNEVQKELMDIGWMTMKGLQQAIPPVYTEWLGSQLLARL